MKPRALLLTLSLLGNAVLAGAYLVRSTSPAGAPAPAASPAPAGAVATSPASAATPGNAKIDPAAGTAAKASFSWAAIETSDLDELVRRLKAAGFTSGEIRVILSQRINQMTFARPSATDAKPRPYWQAASSPASDANPNDFAKRMAEQMKLARKYLMGPDSLGDDPERLDYAKRQWGDLPLEKLQAIATIEADYQEMSMQQYAERRSRPGETGGADAMRIMEQERMADIAKILTPEEFAAFELRASGTANRLRYQLETFKPTEDEYKAVFALYKAYDSQLNDPKLSPDARKALGAELTSQVKAVLGEERALDYDAAVNQNSQDQTGRLVARLNLPAHVASEVRQAQQDFTQRAKAIRANTALSSADRTTQLDALVRQAESLLTAKLGADGFEAYSDLKGDWLRNIRSSKP